jgi:hypothetical protein
MCRVRKIKGNESTCSFPLEDTISVADRDVKGAVSRKKFAFDRIFEPEATQTQVAGAITETMIEEDRCTPQEIGRLLTLSALPAAH